MKENAMTGQSKFGIFQMIFVSILLVAVVLLFAPCVRAQEAPSLSIELNSFAKSKAGCRVNFVMRNGMVSAVESLVLEIVLFNKEGGISRILALGAGALPVGKTRVKQFRLKNCASLSRILVNDIIACKGEELTPKSCLKVLKTKNRTDIEFGL
jgi:hypothetical protein